MFKKLLKHDFKSVKRFGVPVLFALLGAALLGMIGIVGTIKTIQSYDRGVDGLIATLLSTCFMLLIFFVLMVIFSANAGTQIAVLVDYYKTLVTDEGYLTFTLPVKPWQILTSKLLNSCLWNLIAAAGAALAGGAILMAGLAAGGILDEFLGSLVEMLREIKPEPGAVIMIFLLLVLAVVYIINNQLLHFMAIFFGSVIAKKNKLLAAIGCIFGAHVIYGFVSNILSVLVYIPTLSSTVANNAWLTINVCLLACILLLGALSVLFFWLTKYMMEKKLNLA